MFILVLILMLKLVLILVLIFISVESSIDSGKSPTFVEFQL